jgi:hypothetical protein
MDLYCTKIDRISSYFRLIPDTKYTDDFGTTLIKRKCIISTTEFATKAGKNYKSEKPRSYLLLHNLIAPTLPEILNLTHLTNVINCIKSLNT